MIAFLILLWALNRHCRSRSSTFSQTSASQFLMWSEFRPRSCSIECSALPAGLTERSRSKAPYLFQIFPRSGVYLSRKGMNRGFEESTHLKAVYLLAAQAPSRVSSCAFTHSHVTLPMSRPWACLPAGTPRCLAAIQSQPRPRACFAGSNGSAEQRRAPSKAEVDAKNSLYRCGHSQTPFL